MLSSVLRSEIAVNISVQIIRVFVSMRKIISQNISMFERFERIEQRLTIHDKNFDKLFEALDDKSLKAKQGIFYDGQIFDAYIDETVFTLFSKYPNIYSKYFKTTQT
jgi:hypothetical protein